MTVMLAASPALAALCANVSRRMSLTNTGKYQMPCSRGSKRAAEALIAEMADDRHDFYFFYELEMNGPDIESDHQHADSSGIVHFTMSDGLIKADLGSAIIYRRRQAEKAMGGRKSMPKRKQPRRNHDLDLMNNSFRRDPQRIIA